MAEKCIFKNRFILQMHIHVYTHTHARTHAHTHARTHTHTHTHTHTNTHTLIKMTYIRLQVLLHLVSVENLTKAKLDLQLDCTSQYVSVTYKLNLSHVIINPRRACAERVTVVVSCVCVCVCVCLYVCLSECVNQLHY